MKKARPSNFERLGHILDAIASIEKATVNKTFDDFFNNEILHTAVAKWIENIGEASYQIEKPLKEKYTAIDWKRIEGMRHIIVHEYFGIDLDAVWIVVELYLKELKQEVQKIIKDL
jgi:uncharacterized protein with HEPN domain